MKNTNVFRTLQLLAKDLEIPVTKQGIANELERHPRRNSLRAVSDVLDNWGVANEAFQLSMEDLIRSNLPVPYIGYLSSNNNEFVVINSFTQYYVEVSNERWTNHRMSLDEFRKIYKGTVLVAEKDGDSKEPEYEKNRRKEFIDRFRYPTVLFLAISLFLFFLMANPFPGLTKWNILLLIITKTTGLVTAVLLLIQGIDSNNAFIERFCGRNSNNCSSILSSSASKLTEEVSWSEVGFFYFAGTLLSLIFNSNNLITIEFLALLNLLALPYTFYSIYYQWRIAKQWCIFCCTIQFLLWLEFFSFFPITRFHFQMPEVKYILNIAICMLLPILAWITAKPYFLQKKRIQHYQDQLNKFKYNADIFDKLLKNEAQYSLPNKEESITLGNPDAQHTLTVVSNPFCQPCARAHKLLDEWLENRDDIKLQIIFAVEGDPTSSKNRVAGHLMSLQATSEGASLTQAIKKWFDQKEKSYEEWAKFYPINQPVSIEATLEKQRQWCKIAGINTTPTIFINGRKLPENYQAADIRYLI